MKKSIVLSSLNHTWFIDIDGTIFKHNGYKFDGHDSLLPGVKEFFESIPEDDLIILVTSRTDEYKNLTLKSLEENKIKYDEIIFNAPYGERIVVNDNKLSGLKTGKCINIERDEGLNNILVEIDREL